MEVTDQLHVADPVAKMEELVYRAENGETQLVETARLVLAMALIKGRPVDEERLKRLATRIGENGRGSRENLLLWSPLLTACAGYIEHKQVAMKDGRCATSNGWDYSNCESESLHVSVSRELSEELDVRTLTDAEPSNDPERNPSEYDTKYDEAVAAALTAFLENKG